ncbi:Glycosyltransferase, family GT4 [Tenacibaculum sp. 190524A02b]|uniref:Glycosyltransferase, family GT4 n=1 Tax=Tenacibaculum vairaonense TaxID=3137860 RepID=A0ABM9PJF5_9FLAO
MKIIHIITAFGIGGAEKLLLEVANIQVKEHDVHLIYLKPIDDLVSFLDKDVKIKRIGLSITTIKELKNYYRKVKPDIIHTHLSHADILGLWSAKKIPTKLFCTMHNIHFKKNYIDLFLFRIYRFLFTSRKIKPNVISISKAVEEHVISTLKVAQNNSFLLYNAIPVKREQIERENLTIDRVKLLFIGRLEKQKSLDTLLDAIAYLNNDKILLTIVGDGALRCFLEKKVDDLKLTDNVTFEGKQKNTSKFYENADIFILPSIWEGFGIVILEAFRAKVPVIASNIEGPSELIKNNVNGVLFEPKNHIQLAEKIKHLIDNKSLRQKIAENGYKSFSDEFEISNYVKKLNELYVKA